MKTARKSKYANVPLCFLAYGSSMRERAGAALAFGLVDTALHSDFIASLDESDGDGEAAVEYEDFTSYDMPDDADEDNDVHRRVLFTARRCGFTVHSMNNVLREHGKLEKFVQAHESRYGTDARTKVHFSLLFQLHGGTAQISDDEFAVYAAINSNLGRHPVTKTAQNAIRMRALGYKSAAAFAAELDKRTDGARPLQNHTISRLTDKLVRHGFIKKMSLHRATYYAQPHLSDAQFAELVTKSETRRVVDETRKRETAAFVAAQVRKSRDDARRARVVRRAQSDLFNGAPAPVAFHRVDELRAQYSAQDFVSVMNAPNTKTFKLDGVQYVAVSTLPVAELKKLCAQAHGGAKNGGESATGETIVF